MPKITVVISEDEYSLLTDASAKNKCSISDYVRSKLFDEDSIKKQSVVSIHEVIERAMKRKGGEEFTIPSLFTLDQYTGVNRGVAGTIGRQFGVLVKGKYSDEFEQLGKQNRQTVYRRKNK